MKCLQVVKIGGSLLDWQGFGSAISGYLTQSLGPLLFIAGGGKKVAAIRELSRRERWANEKAHWQAIRAMSENARLLVDFVPESTIVSGVDMTKLRDDSRLILDCEPWLRDSRWATELPASWDVTSDSIAAAVALELDAELILLKSCAQPDLPLEELPNVGFVDAFFPQLARQVRLVRFGQLREFDWLRNERNGLS